MRPWWQRWRDGNRKSKREREDKKRTIGKTEGQVLSVLKVVKFTQVKTLKNYSITCKSSNF